MRRRRRQEVARLTEEYASIRRLLEVRGRRPGQRDAGSRAAVTSWGGLGRSAPRGGRRLPLLRSPVQASGRCAGIGLCAPAPVLMRGLAQWPSRCRRQLLAPGRTASTAGLIGWIDRPIDQSTGRWMQHDTYIRVIPAPIRANVSASVFRPPPQRLSSFYRILSGILVFPAY